MTHNELVDALTEALPDYHWRHRAHSDTYVGTPRQGMGWLSVWWERDSWRCTMAAPGPEQPPARGPMPVDLAVAVHTAQPARPALVSEHPPVRVVRTARRFFTPDLVDRLVEEHPMLTWGLAVFMDGAVGRCGALTIVVSYDRFGIFAKVEGAPRDEDSVFRGKTASLCVGLALESAAWARLTGAEHAREAS